MSYFFFQFLKSSSLPPVVFLIINLFFIIYIVLHYYNNVSKLTEDNATEELNSYLIYLNKNTTLKSVSIDNYSNRIKSFLNRCLKLRVGKTKKYSSSRVKKGYKYLTVDEISKLIATIPETTDDEVLMARNKAILTLLFTSGLRVSEMCNLTAADIIHSKN